MTASYDSWRMDNGEDPAAERAADQYADALASLLTELRTSAPGIRWDADGNPGEATTVSLSFDLRDLDDASGAVAERLEDAALLVRLHRKMTTAAHLRDLRASCSPTLESTLRAVREIEQRRAAR